MGRILTEVCVDSIDGIRAATAGGADRVELCAALEVGGVTPSEGLQELAEGQQLPVHVLVRPRGGDFCYSDTELATMVADVERAVKRGAAAVVVGALTPDAEVDVTAMRRLMDAAGSVPVTFHRAIDMAADPLGALDTLISLGVNRVLTSGRRRSAADGTPLIGSMVAAAGDELVVLAGGGINPSNAAKLVAATGVGEIHFSARRYTESPMTFRNDEVTMGSDGEEYRLAFTDPDVVAATVAAVRSE